MSGYGTDMGLQEEVAGTPAAAPTRPYRHQPFLDWTVVGIDDDTGRVSLPAMYRYAFVPGPRAAAISPIELHLEMWTPESFDLTVAHRRTLPTGELDDEPLRFKRLQRRSAWLALDKQFRLVIPDRMREFAEISDRVVFAGTGESLQVWSVERFEADMDGDESSIHDDRYPGLY